MASLQQNLYEQHTVNANSKSQIYNEAEKLQPCQAETLLFLISGQLMWSQNLSNN